MGYGYEVDFDYRQTGVGGAGNVSLYSRAETFASNIGSIQTLTQSSVSIEHLFATPVSILVSGFVHANVADTTIAGAAVTVNGIPLDSYSILLHGASSMRINAIASVNSWLRTDSNPDTPTPPTDSLYESASVFIGWSVWDPEVASLRRGVDPDNPVLGGFWALVDIDEDHPIGATTKCFGFPLVDSAGLTDDAYFALPTRVDAGVSAGALATGFEFSAQGDSVFASFRVPELGPGSQSLTLSFDSHEVPVIEGQAIDFGAGGITSFVLRGFDTNFASNAHDALVFGMRFVGSDVAGFAATAIIDIPPGDFDENGLANGEDFLAWQRGGSPNNGSAEDLAVWQAHFGEPVAMGSAAQTVPEPASGLIVAAGLVSMATQRRRHLA